MATCPGNGDRLESYRPLILAVALDRLDDPEACQDVVQDVMELALRHVADLRDPDALPAWLRVVTINCCRQRQRRAREESVGLVVKPEQESESTYRVALRRELLRSVRAAVADLPEKNRLALLLHLVHGWSYEAIARALDVPLTTVEGRIHRARQALRRSHEDWLAEALRR